MILFHKNLVDYFTIRIADIEPRDLGVVFQIFIKSIKIFYE
jgi:hypothetical protein